MITLPGLIDTHVHLREPGAIQKEDFETGTKAAIAGGYTTVLDMPNNPKPTISSEALEKKIQLASGIIQSSSSVILSPKGEGSLVNTSTSNKLRDSSSSPQNDKGGANSRIYANVGFHFGATQDSTKYSNQIKDKVFALKVYMNHTTGTLLQEDPQALELIFSTWPKDKIIMVHAEGPTLKKAINLARQFGNKLHVCHVSQTMEIELIKQAKSDGINVTCEVTCHHLFLTREDAKKLGPYGMMRPPLATKEDQQSLWDAISDGTVDTIASDHAPHTKEEKENPPAGGPPNGVPGLETTLPLLLTAMKEGRLTEEKLIQLTSTNPRKIFNIPQQFDTVVEVDPDIPYTINHKLLYTKCGWTPFEGKKVTGKIKRVVLKGQMVFKDGEVLESPQGKIIYPE